MAENLKTGRGNCQLRSIRWILLRWFQSRKRYRYYYGERLHLSFSKKDIHRIKTKLCGMLARHARNLFIRFCKQDLNNARFSYERKIFSTCGRGTTADIAPFLFGIRPSSDRNNQTSLFQGRETHIEYFRWKSIGCIAAVLSLKSAITELEV